MAKSQQKTKLARLRAVLGPVAGSEARFAETIGRSKSWVKKASCGTIPLTEDAAVRIAHETGVAPEWLLEENTTRPPYKLDTFLEPYTKADYDARRAGLLYGSEDLHDECVDALMQVPSVFRRISAIVVTAILSKRVPLTLYRLDEFADQMEKEFGSPVQNTTNMQHLIFNAVLKHLPPPVGDIYEEDDVTKTKG